MTTDPSEWDWTRIVFDHVHLRVADVQESRRFYELVLAPLGLPLMSDTPHFVQFPNFALSDDKAPTQGAHVAFMARSREEVIRFHQAGVDAGFRDNGAPGFRDYTPGWYAAYLLDPDGNNIEALFREAPDASGV
jgi:catechol 2,3-dioxygenase-like lactoylglutathione lyase family enzyme